MDELNTYWDYLTGNGLVSEETLSIITSINGYNVDTLNDVLYVVTGYRTLQQYDETMEEA